MSATLWEKQETTRDNPAGAPLTGAIARHSARDRGAIVGRPEAPLDAREEPLREFASRLRRLREESGGRSYRQLARSANFAAPTLARAASGRSLPSWEVTRAYVAACGGDPDQWHAMWASTARLLGRD